MKHQESRSTNDDKLITLEAPALVALFFLVSIVCLRLCARDSIYKLAFILSVTRLTRATFTFANGSRGSSLLLGHHNGVQAFLIESFVFSLS